MQETDSSVRNKEDFMKTFVYTKEEIKRLEQTTMDHEQMDAFTLMKRAAKRLFEYSVKHTSIEKHSKILVICGPGNNGGDAFLLAHLLATEDYQVRCVKVGPKHKGSHAHMRAFDIAQETLPITFIEEVLNIEFLYEELKTCDVVIDGLFGVGINRPITSPFKETIVQINLSRKPCLSIDIPSGVNADNGLIQGEAVKATHTMIVGAYKPGNLLGDALDTHGALTLAPIGLKNDKVNSKQFQSLEDFNVSIGSRKHNTHKYDYGQIMIIGGSPDMPGAPHLSGLAALRTGSGLVRIALDQATKAVVSPVHYELTYHTYDTPNELLDKLKKTSSIIYGIGMGEIDNQEAFLTALIHKKIPIVIDGDGLKVLKKIIWDFPNSLEHVIIMPHVGEMARLLDQTSKEILNDPLKAVTSLTSKTNMTIALKGPATIIANRDNVTFIQAKNPGLATAGSGDTLAGITASLLGRHMVPFDALRLSVVLHSKAGLYASKALGEESLIASDIITYLPHAFKDIKKH